jgi:hypothetical protein
MVNGWVTRGLLALAALVPSAGSRTLGNKAVGWTRCAGIIAITEGRGPGQHDPLLAIVSYFENLGVLVMTVGGAIR